MKKISLLIILFFGIISSYAQIPNDLSQVKSSQISDAQLKQYIDQAAKAGVSEQQVIAEFKKRGLPESEMQLLRTRIQLLQSGTGNGAAATNNPIKTEGNTIRTAPVNETIAPPVNETAQAPVIKSSGLQVFGADLFSKANISFEPNLKMPTPKNYTLAASDQLIIDVFGINEKTQTVTINPEGTIRLDYVGQIFLNGLTIEEATNRIKSKLVKVYPNLNSGRTKLTVSLGSIRSIKITILGEVVKPGTYTLSSLSTIFNALYTSGGPNESGSFREIELIRNSKVIQKIDIYNFLLKGDQSQNVRLEDMDVIRIPIAKTKVSISGAVKRQGIFEMMENDTFEKLLDYAGGFKDDAYKSLIKAERFTEKEKKIVDVVDSQFKTLKLISGDAFEVSSILDRYENKVTIVGSVFRPGVFAMNKGMTLNELIKKAEGFTEDVFLERAILTRYKDDYTKELIALDLRDSSVINNFEVKKNDNITISSIFDFKNSYQVSISGAVRKPGSFPFIENITLKDLLQFAGGLKEDAFLEKAMVTRYNENGTKEILRLDLRNLDSSNSNFVLQKKDEISISSIYDFMDSYTVSIAGAVRKPGFFPFLEGISLNDVIQMAGGLKEDIYLGLAVLTRRNKDRTSEVINFSLDSLLKNNVTFPLQQEDQIYISSKSEMKDVYAVSIFGEVHRPGKFDYSENLTLKSLLFKAGGFTDNASLRNIEIARKRNDISPNDPNARLSDLIRVELKDNNLNNITDDIKLEREDVITIKSDPFRQAPRTVTIYGEVLFPGTYTLETRKLRLTELIKRAGGLTVEASIDGTRLGRYKPENSRTDKVAVQKIAVQLKDSTGNLKTIYEKETDEIVIDLKAALNNPGGNADINLEPQDFMFIPKYNPMVGVSGEILRPIKTPYVSGKSLKYYINAAAGFVSSADKSKIFVVHANGFANNTKKVFGIFRSYPRVYPGTNIFVPKEYIELKKGFDAQKSLVTVTALSALATMVVAIINATK